MRKGLRIGIDLGGTQVKLGLVDQRGVIVASHALDTDKNPRALASMIGASVRSWRNRPILGTGVGVAGDVDAGRGVVRFSPNLGWKNVALADLFRRAGVPGPVRFDNDANAAAWGAYHAELGACVDDLILLTLGTGVGGGLVLGGRLHRGATGTAGEIGHLVVDPRGPRCGCGNRGCLETYLGAKGLSAWAARADRTAGRRAAPSTPEELARRARSGDAVSLAAWDRAGRALGAALASLVNVLNPDLVMLTGGIARSARLFLPLARREMNARAFRTPARAVRFRVSRRPGVLGLVGAALLVE